jgi:RHS repeat-associated protein
MVAVGAANCGGRTTIFHIESTASEKTPAARPLVPVHRFGRTKDQRWRFTGQTPADRDRYRYGHDYASNRLWRENALTHGTVNQFDEAYTHDGLHRLQDAARGTLDDPPSEGLLARTFEQAWGLDQVGNWPTFKEGDGTDWTLDQTREHNTVNEITDITEGQGQAEWVTPTWDARGNMTSGPKPGAETTEHRYVSDAWNRLVQVKDATNTIIETYRYNGLARRVRKLQGADPENPTTAFDYFYNASWQVLEERKDADVYCQYVWSARYIDAPVLRERNNDQDPDLEERLYCTTDANMNVTALVNTSGTVVERYVYDPYGKVSVLNPDWSDDEDGDSDFGNEILYCGYRFDPETGLYHVRHRYLHPTLGRWLSRDPIGYVVGVGLQEYCASRVTGAVDPLGLLTADPRGPMKVPRPPTPTLPPIPPPTPPPLPAPAAPKSLAACICGPDVGQALVQHLNDVVPKHDKMSWGFVNYGAEELSTEASRTSQRFAIAEREVYGCPSGRMCEGTLTICGKCIAAPHLTHILAMVYVGQVYGERSARGAGYAREAQSDQRLGAFVRGMLEGKLGIEGPPTRLNSRWSISDLAMNEVGLCVSEKGRSTRWDLPAGRQFSLSMEGLCGCFDRANWTEIKKKPARYGTGYFDMCEPCQSSVSNDALRNAYTQGRASER